jgi:hypothetical protein
MQRARRGRAAGSRDVLVPPPTRHCRLLGRREGVGGAGGRAWPWRPPRAAASEGGRGVNGCVAPVISASRRLCRHRPHPRPRPPAPSPPPASPLLQLRMLAMATLRRLHPQHQPLRRSTLPRRPQARMIAQALAPAPARAASQAPPTDPPQSQCATPREPGAPPHAAALRPHALAYPTATQRPPTRASATATPRPRRPPPAHNHTRTDACSGSPPPPATRALTSG